MCLKVWEHVTPSQGFVRLPALRQKQAIWFSSLKNFLIWNQNLFPWGFDRSTWQTYLKAVITSYGSPLLRLKILKLLKIPPRNMILSTVSIPNWSCLSFEFTLLYSMAPRNEHNSLECLIRVAQWRFLSPSLRNTLSVKEAWTSLKSSSAELTSHLSRLSH